MDAKDGERKGGMDGGEEEGKRGEKGERKGEKGKRRGKLLHIRYQISEAQIRTGDRI